MMRFVWFGLTFRLTFSLDMAASSLLLFHKPTCNFCFGPSPVPAFKNSARFLSWSSNFPLNRRRIWSVSGRKTMADSVKTHAWRDGNNNDGEERFQTLEQDAFINTSSELQNDLVSDTGGIEAVANRLVGVRIHIMHTTCLM